MGLPSDYRPELWLSALEFQGLIGRSLARGEYGTLFREDGFAKSMRELQQTPIVKHLLPEPYRIKEPRRSLWQRIFA